jgi:hypothetical protein
MRNSKKEPDYSSIRLGKSPENAPVLTLTTFLLNNKQRTMYATVVFTMTLGQENLGIKLRRIEADLSQRSLCYLLLL